MGNFKFGEHSTKDFDLVIQAPPTYVFPEKDVSKEHVPGRNGDLIIDNKCWKNTERTYSIASVFRPGTDFVSNSERLIKWLTSYKGYHRLEDSYDPEVYRLAEFSSNGSLTNYYDIATVINITFNCKPQRYLKNGEKSVKFSDSVATLENPTGYPALPEITIKGVNPSENEVLLVTVKNELENNVTSIVTLNKIKTAEGAYDVILNSELQTVYSIQNGDINAYVNLNELEFPTLYKGKTRISIDTYLENQGLVEQYNSLINEKVVGNNVCLAKYKPFDSIVETKQKSAYAMSFDLLKQKQQSVYEAKAYANYCLEKAEQYTFDSFNIILQTKSQSFSFQGDYSDFPDWLSITGSGDAIEIRAGNLSQLSDYNKNYGYFITTNTGSTSDKKIIRVASNGLIANNVKESKTITITFYPADSNGNLDVNYSDRNIPEWLGFQVDEYSNDSDHSPKSISFLHTKSGFYYLPKSGLFGKATWKRFNENDQDKVLNTLTWSTWKKAFMPSGVSTSTTASYTYYYLPYPYKGTQGSQDYQEYLQYEPIYQNELNDDGSVKVDANGNPISKIVSDVYFKVEPRPTSDSAIGSIVFIATKSGYFRFNESGQTGTNKDPIYNGWFQGTAGSQLSGAGVPAGTDSVNNSNIIYFLEDIPTYEVVETWPDWLEESPVLDSGVISNTFGFIVKKSAWYQYTYVDSNTGNTNKSLWTYIEANNQLGEKKEGVFTPYNAPHDESFTIYMLEGDEDEFPVKKYTYTDSQGHTIENIGFFKIDNQGNEIEYDGNNPPSWLKVIIEPGTKEDYSDYVLNFYPQQNGLYKWDTMSVWNLKEASDEKELVSSTGTDDTSVYFMNSLPQYPTEETIYDYCSVEINVNASTGNPESISIYAKVEGYYRAKNSSSWKYYNENDKICDSKVSESTPIYYLTDSENEVQDISIEIIPRWWSL